MKRPVPEAHITSPPQMVSMPKMALPISSSYCALMLSPSSNTDVGQAILPADALSSASRRRLESGGSQDWLPHCHSLCRRDPNHRYTHSATNRAAEINCEATSLP